MIIIISKKTRFLCCFVVVVVNFLLYFFVDLKSINFSFFHFLLRSFSIFLFTYGLSFCYYYQKYNKYFIFFTSSHFIIELIKPNRTTTKEKTERKLFHFQFPFLISYSYKYLLIYIFQIFISSINFTFFFLLLFSQFLKSYYFIFILCYLDLNDKL